MSQKSLVKSLMSQKSPVKSPMSQKSLVKSPMSQKSLVKSPMPQKSLVKSLVVSQKSLVSQKSQKSLECFREIWIGDSVLLRMSIPFFLFNSFSEFWKLS
jgi:hypothetical protein